MMINDVSQEEKLSEAVILIYPYYSLNIQKAFVSLVIQF
jgi:hypothetical protein